MLLEGVLAKVIGGALNSLMVDGELRRDTETSLDLYGDAVVGTPGVFRFRGFDDDVTVHRSRMLPETEKVVGILATSISTVPVPGDEINFRGGWYKILEVVTDPARALYECQCMKVGVTTHGG